MKKAFVTYVRLVTLLTGVLCGHALAQTPDFSPPPLPPIPSVGTPALTGDTNAKANPDPSTIPGGAAALGPLPANPTAPLTTLPSLATPNPVAEQSPNSTTTDALPEAAASVDAATPADDAAATLPAPASVPGEEGVALDNAIIPVPGNESAVAATAPAALPGLSLPLPGAESAISPTPVSAPVQVATLPEVNATITPAEEAPIAATPRRTWKTTLAPAIIPPRTRFNYRRQLLPDRIYRTEYDRENQHLPTRTTREDYVQLLYQRAAANDIDGTRALLNTGLATHLNQALSAARQAGARDTERLLIARGARG